LEINQDLLKRVAKRDHRSILLLYNQCFAFMMQRLSRLSLHKEEQMSVMNTAFLKAIERIDTFDSSKDFKAWLGTIVKNEFIDQYRKKQAHAKHYNDVQPSFEDTTDKGADILIQLADTDQLYIHLIDALPETTRIVFNLYVLEEMSREEIAQSLDMSYDAVKWHILKARKQIAEQLKMTPHEK
jgi:RNA polymerase sigma-70 factor (ECF subfamily)